MTHQQAARDAVDGGMARVVSTIAVILPSLALLQVLASPEDYRRPAAAVVVWLGVLGSGAWLVPRLRTGGLGRAQTAAAVAIAVAAVAAVDDVYRPRGAAGGVDLAVLGTAWLLVLVVLSNPARVWVPAALLVLTVHGALLIRGEGLSPVGLSQLGAAGYIIAAMLILFAALRQVLDTRVSIAARQASLASRAAAERAAATAITSERRARLAVLEQEALPLLRAIAVGALDPADENVRTRCARHAAALRHSLEGHSLGGHAVAGGGEPGDGSGAWPTRDGLVAGLRETLRAAAARDQLVTLQVIGGLAAPSAPLVRAAAATVDAVLSELPPHELLLTVLAADDDTELYLTFGRPLRAVPDLTRFGRGLPAAARWRAQVSVAEEAGGSLEVSWHRGGAW